MKLKECSLCRAGSYTEKKRKKNPRLASTKIHQRPFPAFAPIRHNSPLLAFFPFTYLTAIIVHAGSHFSHAQPKRLGCICLALPCLVLSARLHVSLSLSLSLFFFFGSADGPPSAMYVTCPLVLWLMDWMYGIQRCCRETDGWMDGWGGWSACFVAACKLRGSWAGWLAGWL